MAPGNTWGQSPTATGAELGERLAWLERRMALLVEGDPGAAGQTFRGIYMSFDQARATLHARTDGPIEESPPLGPWTQTFAERNRLDRHDVDILTVAVAPEIDVRWQRLFGFVHDDLTRRWATVALACTLAGLDLTRLDVRQRFVTGGLRRAALLEVDDDGPFAGRTVRVPDHVVDVLLGSTAVEPLVAAVAVPAVDVRGPDVERIAAELTGGCSVHAIGPPEAAPEQLAAAAAGRVGLGVLIADLTELGDPAATLESLTRHHALTGDAVVIAAVERLVERVPDAVRQWRRASSPTITAGQRPWTLVDEADTPRQIDVGAITTDEQRRHWHAALAANGADHDPAVADRLVASFRLTPLQIHRAAASLADGPTDFDQLAAAARRQSSAGLGPMVRRLDPSAEWDDLVLPADVAVLLHDLALRVRHRQRVMNDWGMARGWRRQGLAALFAGPSGTGKTMAAEVIAHSLGLDLHVVDLASVIDKYIGETEKRLEVIFAAAEQTNTVLLFDEADAIFGKRSEVKDARDRYANIEVAYLLQRIERFSGLAILTTNLGANLDEAFTRRLDVVVDFPRPDGAARERLWRKELRPPLPVGDVDVPFCAAAFEMTGGEIRNAVLTAAYLAAEAGGSVGMAEVIHAVQREFHKMGRLCVPTEFGAYATLLQR